MATSTTGDPTAGSPVLTLHRGSAGPISGERLLIEAADLARRHLLGNVGQVPDDDPYLAEIKARVGLAGA